MELKHTQRTGWTRYPLTDVESVADHSFGIAALALTLDLPPHIKRDRLIQMALAHDMAESIVGDIVVERTGDLQTQMSVDEKAKKETKAAEQLFQNQPDLLLLFEEYEAQITPDAKFLKELDKLEMVFQALDYEKKIGQSDPFTEFWENAKKYIKTPQVKKIYDELHAMRFT